jgi:uncharacterized protein (TIGR00251 family)
VERDGGSELSIYVTPRAGRSEVAGEREGALWLKLAAPPVEGAANEALIALLARRLEVPRSALQLVAGATGRRKRVRIARLAPGAVTARLQQAARPRGSTTSIVAET